MDQFFFPANDFSLLENCQLYIIAKYKASNCCKIEAVIQSCSVKEVLLKILRNSQKNPCARISFLINLQLTKRLWHRCFLVNIAKWWRKLSLEHSSGCLWQNWNQVSKISKNSVPAIFDYTWYHGLPLHYDKIVVKRDIHRK